MKFLKTLITAFAAVVVIFGTGSSANAETMSLDQTKAVVNVIKQSLPMEVEKGMVWEDATLTDNNKVLQITFKMNPAKMGATNEDAKSVISSYDAKTMAGLFGEEFMQTMKSMGVTGRVVFVLPDGYKRSINFQ